MINPQEILKKLKVKKLSSIRNIIQNEELCRRIIKEKPVKVTEFIKKDIMSTYFLKSLIKVKLITVFANSEHRGSPKYIFENEIENQFQNIVYDRPVTQTFLMASEFILSVLEEAFTKQELDILRIFLIDLGDKKKLNSYLKKYDVKEVNAYHVFYRSLAKIRRKKNLYDLIIKDYASEKFKLLDEVETLRQLKDHLYFSVRKKNDNNVQKINVENLGILATKIEHLDLSVRVFNCLSRARIETVLELIKYTREDMLKHTSFGEKSLQEVESLLAKYGLKFSEQTEP